MLILYLTGFCTEYSAKENMIQQNFGLFCLTFTKTPCPIFYRSDEAYKCELWFFFFLPNIYKRMNITVLNKG